MTGEKSPTTRDTARASKSPSTSPKGSNAGSPKEGSPESAAAVAGILPAQHWVQTAQDPDVDNSDAESIGSVGTSTDSLTSSILKYRKIHGRTYHSEVGNAAYWGANDSQQNESMDINHHVLTLALGGKLFLAPLETEKIQKVLDIGTGTGTWAIDFADEHPNAQVVGTDISPIQPAWVPPNLKFEIEDCTREWTYEADSFDYVHIRWLLGSIGDWNAAFAEAYRVLKPGGWLESHESGSIIESDDGTVTEDSALGQWGKIFVHFGESIGRRFTVIAEHLQRKAADAAGFVDIDERNLKIPLGSWPKDPHLKEIGQYAQIGLEADIEGYCLYPATALGWKPEEVSVYAAHVRNEIRSLEIHSYYRQRVIWARKPLTPQEE